MDTVKKHDLFGSGITVILNGSEMFAGSVYNYIHTTFYHYFNRLYYLVQYPCKSNVAMYMFMDLLLNFPIKGLGNKH